MIDSLRSTLTRTLGSWLAETGGDDPTRRIAEAIDLLETSVAALRAQEA